jgi:hypothetical protein
MDHGLPLVPVVVGVLLAYTAHFVYSIVQFASLPQLRRTVRDWKQLVAPKYPT